MTSAYEVNFLVTLATVVLGALTFSVLAVFYWRERRSRPASVFTAFTAVCATAFSINLAMRIGWETPLTAALDLVAGMAPPLLVHLVAGSRGRALRGTFYVVCGCVAALLALDDLDVLSAPFRDQLPAIIFGAAGILGLVLLKVESRLQLWYRWLLGLTALIGAASLLNRSALTVLAPDYILLAFFCVTLYYQERLIFFDLLIKRGAVFLLALVTVTAMLLVARAPGAVRLALVLAPFWLLSPWVDARLSRLIDRVFLRRRYSTEEAERLFIHELQAAATETGLHARAEHCLTQIFQGSARVCFEPTPEPPASSGEMIVNLQGLGWVSIEPRAGGIPYMSDDTRLFDSLVRTLSVVLENVRFREQQQRQKDREHQLNLLASRAELKALRAQINPHFLFNALNAIAGLIATQPDLADRTIEELAQVFRYTLRKSENEWVRLDEEVEFVRAYLRVETARFGERLRVRIVIGPGAGSVAVPAMCVQPLIENAVKHGSSQINEGGTVELSAVIEEEMLHLEVRDSGAGFPAGFSLAESAGHGLRNVADRLKGYYGAAAQFGWESGPTRVWFRLPCPASEEVKHRCAS